MTNTKTDITLMPQKGNDQLTFQFLRTLYNNPQVASTYFNNVSRPTSTDEVDDYIHNLLLWSEYDAYLIIYEGMLVGEVGYLSGANTINVAILPQFQGLGIAKLAVQQIMEKSKSKSFTATILSDNIGSIKLFTSLGFVKTGRNEEFELDIYTLEN